MNESLQNLTKDISSTTVILLIIRNRTKDVSSIFLKILEIRN